MYTLKGFIEIEGLISNSPGVTAPIGELSTTGLTYAKDEQVYNSADHPTLRVVAFKSTDSTGVVVAPTAILASVFAHAGWINQAQTLSGSSTTRAAFLPLYVAQFTSSATSIDCGELINSQGDSWFPEWVSYQLTGLDPADPAFNNTVLLWFSDDSFRHQYDEYSITVVPPLPSIDTFFAGPTAVVAALATVTLSQTLIAVQTAKAGYPETVVSAENFNYVDPTNPANLVPTNWTQLMYGIAGNDLDSIRNAIRLYIAANSAHTELEWRGLFPDIYKSTEFVIFPRWNNYAIADRVLQAGVYSPLVSLKKELDYLKTNLPLLPSTHVDNFASVIPCTYKSLALLLIGGPDNRNNLFTLSLVYPDLFNVPTSDTLFDAMMATTRAWVLWIEAMLIAAESMTAFSDVPAGLSRINRAGILYVGKTFDNILYLVATKASTPAY